MGGEKRLMLCADDGEFLPILNLDNEKRFYNDTSMSNLLLYQVQN